MTKRSKIAKAPKPRFRLHKAMCRALLESLEKVTERELRGAWKECDQMTETNVWWFPYEIRQALKEVISGELAARKAGRSRGKPLHD